MNLWLNIKYNLSYQQNPLHPHLMWRLSLPFHDLLKCFQNHCAAHFLLQSHYTEFPSYILFYILCVQKLTNKVSCLIYILSHTVTDSQSHLLIKLIGDGSYQLLNCQIYFLHVFCRSIDLGYFSVDKLLPIQQCNMQHLEASALRV